MRFSHSCIKLQSSRVSDSTLSLPYSSTARNTFTIIKARLFKPSLSPTSSRRQVRPTMLSLNFLIVAAQATCIIAQSTKSPTCTITSTYTQSTKSSSCTMTSTYTPSVCCPQIPAKTAFDLIECGGCALTTETVPLNCLMPCTVSPTVDLALTTTITECDQIISLTDPVTKM